MAQSGETRRHREFTRQRTEISIKFPFERVNLGPTVVLPVLLVSCATSRTEYSSSTGSEEKLAQSRTYSSGVNAMESVECLAEQENLPSDASWILLGNRNGKLRDEGKKQTKKKKRQNTGVVTESTEREEKDKSALKLGCSFYYPR